MTERPFTVTWSINVEATSPETAAMDAREIMLDPATVATIMVVRPEGEEYPAHVFDLENPNAPELVTVDRGDQ